MSKKINSVRSVRNLTAWAQALGRELTVNRSNDGSVFAVWSPKSRRPSAVCYSKEEVQDHLAYLEETSK